MMNEWWIWIVAAVTYLSIGALLLAVPAYVPGSVLFGVFVPEERRSDPAVSRLRSRYAAYMLTAAGLGLAGGAAAAVWGAEQVRAAALPGSMAVLIAGACVAAAAARRGALRMRREMGWEQPKTARRVANLQFRQRRLTISGGWYAIHVALVLISVAAAIACWGRIPDTFATHYNSLGEPNSYSSKTIGSVFMMNIVQLLMIGLFLFLNRTIRFARQQLDPSRPEQSMDQEAALRKVMSVFLYGLSLFIVALFGYLQASLLYGWELGATMIAAAVVPVVLAVSLIGMLAYFRKRGIDPGQGAAVIEERHWKLGGLYYNPEDPSLFVSKRYGIGWTINMGSPAGKWFVAVLALLVIAAIVAAAVGGGR